MECMPATYLPTGSETLWALKLVKKFFIIKKYPGKLKTEGECCN